MKGNILMISSIKDVDFSKSVNLFKSKAVAVSIDDLRKNLFENAKTEVLYVEQQQSVVMRFKYANEYINLNNDNRKLNQFVVEENVSKSDYEANKEKYEVLLKQACDSGMWDDECRRISTKMSVSRT